MPRKLTAKTHTTNCMVCRFEPDSIAKAGIGATKPPEMMFADEEAVVWVILPSPAPNA